MEQYEKHKRGLATTAGAAAALSVIGRRGRNIAKIDGVQFANIDAQFHRWAAIENRKFRFREAAAP